MEVILHVCRGSRVLPWRSRTRGHKDMFPSLMDQPSCNASLTRYVPTSCTRDIRPRSLLSTLLDGRPIQELVQALAPSHAASVHRARTPLASTERATVATTYPERYLGGFEVPGRTSGIWHLGMVFQVGTVDEVLTLGTGIPGRDLISPQFTHRGTSETQRPASAPFPTRPSAQ
ncbi:hypothetical protein VTK73DRAFT_1962 [Phialemonium thermophilum]|uniref:Uncharacterized protein n=1 Tax=Phialemonium thermophilum TaxID=223376 RepID=A0ABR3VSR8_9PEZI